MNRSPMTPEQVQARLDAYRGSARTSRAVVEFTREAVRDSLHVAPQPVTRAWISYATSIVGGLAASCEKQGLPLDRTVVLDRARIERFLSHECAAMTKSGRSSYRSKLDVVAGALLYGQNDAAWPRATLHVPDTVAPWDDSQAARVALWISGARPQARRDRLRVCLAGSLGGGMNRRDLLVVCGRHVESDRHGVRVVIPPTEHDNGRTVIIAASWEREIARAAERVGHANLLVAPDRPTLDPSSFTNSVTRGNRLAPAGDEFTLTRARNTRLVRRLAVGTPLTVLMANAGLTTTHTLEDLLRYVPAVDPVAAAKFMRGV